MTAGTVFEYIDYRQFLRDFVKARGGGKRAFSYRQFSRAAGINSAGYLQQVLNRQRNLSFETTEKFCTGLRLKGREREYFRRLVGFNQASDVGVKAECLSALEKLSPRRPVRALVLNSVHRKFYYTILWELTSCRDFDLTPESAVPALGGRISVTQAAEAIDFLERSQLIVRRDGRYVQTEASITSTSDIEDPFLNRKHAEMTERAREALALPVGEREFIQYHIALSPRSFARVKELFGEFLEKLGTELSSDADAERVYNINLQAFPVTEKVERSRKEESGL